MTFLHLLAGAGVAAAMMAAVRSIGRQSLAVQAIVAAGLLARATVGVALFWISYLQLPMLTSLQLGGGFWSPMLDARGYYTAAAAAVGQGLSTISPHSSSPFFVKTLAAWMLVIGVSPSAGMLLNLCLYTGCCVLLTRLYEPAGRWRSDLPLIVAVAAMSFSPVLVLDSTQALKDDLFLALIIVICASVMLTLRSLATTTARRLPRLLGAACVLAGGVYGVAGIRPYYPVIMSAGLAVALTARIVDSPRGRRLRTAFTGALILVLVWCAYWGGAGPNFRPSGDDRHRVAEWLRSDGGARELIEAILSPLAAVERARRAFVAAGGDTNLAAGSPSLSIVARAGNGLAVLVVPISILKATSVVRFTGGRGLLPIADADTVLTDCGLFGVGLSLFRRRREMRSQGPFMLFGLALALITAGLLGYVVTNLGTLLRMRYLVTTPVWTLALAASPRRFSGEAE